MRRCYYSVSALLLLALATAAIVYAVPAAWVAQHLASATGGRVILAHVRGLWHRGSGMLVLSSGAGGTDAVHWVQRVHWEAAPLRGPVLWALRVTWPQAGPPLVITLGVGLSGWSVQVAPWRGVIPLSALAGLGAPFNTLALDGEAQIGVTALQFSPAPPLSAALQPNVEINIGQLRSALAQGVVLGDYRVLGKASREGGTFELRTVQGALVLEGTGHCRSPERWGRLLCGFEGTARAAQHDDALLGNLLGLLGKRQSPNSIKNLVTELRW